MANQGILQAQLKVKNSMNLENGFVDNPLLKSIEGEINLTDENSFKGFAGNTAIEHLDTIKSSSQNAVDLTNSLNNLSNLKYARLKGNFDSSTEGKFSGNTAMQKLDLSQDITIKPNDLAENESLRELPKLDFSNPDLTDIITNDTNLLPTTFDISDEPNTNKLGIHGDSTHQLGNLEFVKVNPEAPFGSQITPQIDVSYTGLNQNALVNLFNTLPYNVGYTVVGTPTISNGVVSGFSGSDYLTVANFPFASNWETQINATTSSTVSQRLFYRGSLFQLQSASQWKLYINGTSYDFTGYTPIDYPYVKMVKTGNYISVYLSSDGVSFSNVLENASVQGVQEGMLYLSQPSNPWLGTLNLNNTYIKVNGVTWFNGAATRQLDPAATNQGGVTITNGVASGFSSSKYLSISTAPNFTTSLVWRCMFKTGSSLPTETFTPLFIGRSYYNGIGIYKDGANHRLHCRIIPDGGGSIGATVSDVSLDISTTYIGELLWDGTDYTLNLYSKNGVLLGTKTLTAGKFSNNYYAPMLGYDMQNVFNGSIDLNNTFIIADGTKVFSGMVPMTKTCSVVGCPGTADLTADDKAIATGKGWELTDTES